MKYKYHNPEGDKKHSDNLDRWIKLAQIFSPLIVATITIYLLVANDYIKLQKEDEARRKEDKARQNELMEIRNQKLALETDILELKKIKILDENKLLNDSNKILLDERGLLNEQVVQTRTQLSKLDGRFKIKEAEYNNLSSDYDNLYTEYYFHDLYRCLNSAFQNPTRNNSAFKEFTDLCKNDSYISDEAVRFLNNTYDRGNLSPDSLACVARLAYCIDTINSAFARNAYLQSVNYVIEKQKLNPSCNQYDWTAGQYADLMPLTSEDYITIFEKNYVLLGNDSLSDCVLYDVLLLLAHIMHKHDEEIISNDPNMVLNTAQRALSAIYKNKTMKFESYKSCINYVIFICPEFMAAYAIDRHYAIMNGSLELNDRVATILNEYYYSNKIKVENTPSEFSTIINKFYQTSGCPYCVSEPDYVHKINFNWLTIENNYFLQRPEELKMLMLNNKLD